MEGEITVPPRARAHARASAHAHRNPGRGGDGSPRGGVDGAVRRWPLVLIAASAAVAIWSGWVGLGGMCGFGVIHPLPGILPGFQLNMAITLPVSVEAYGAYALGAWMSPHSPPGAREFAKWSAFGALAYGAAGQIIYHLLAAAHATAAPWPVVVVVSCMPVAVLGLAAGLTHLLRLPAATPQDTPAATPEPRQKTRQPAATDRAKANAKARRLLLANPGMPLADVAEKSGVSERTASRIKSGLPVPLRVATAGQAGNHVNR